jgi:predicted phosphodiesterase
MDNEATHRAIQVIKDLALELGRVPRKAEFVAHFPGAEGVMRKCGGFMVLVKSAGLETYEERRKVKINNSIFEINPERHLDQYAPREEPRKREPWPKIAVISDIHWPFANQRVLDAFYKFSEENQPEYVIINGDAWDQYSHAKFPRSHNIFLPKEEQALARKANEEFWVEIKKRVPGAKCYQLLGNHDVRPLKRVLENYPEAEHWIQKMMEELFSFEGVTTLHDAREELMLPGDICVHHGYRSKLGDARDYTRFNAIVGHTHVGGSVFRQVRGQVLWELNSGLAGDAEAKGLTYTSQRITNWTPGFGWVDHHGPRFISV